MKIDRVIQRSILEYLASFYPNQPPQGSWDNLLAITDGDEDVLNANLLYLHEQGCIQKNCLSRALYNEKPIFAPGLIKITYVGLDFLQDDGGISAIKNTVTVRFHADALKVLETYIEHSPQSQSSKQALVQRLRELPASAIEHLMKKLLDEALTHIPDAYQLVEKLLLSC